jgi:hypothetical protein
MRGLLAIGLGTAAGYAPVIAHDVFNRFSTVRTLLQLPAVHVAPEPWPTHAAKAFWNFSNVLSGQALWVSKLGPPSPLPLSVDWAQGVLLTASLAAAALLLAVQSVRAEGRPSWRARLRLPETRLLLLTWAPVFYLALSSTPITRHYFLVLFPMPFVILSVAADRLAARSSLRRDCLLAAAGVAIALNLTTVAYAWAWLARTGGAAAYGPTLANREAAVSFIRADSGGEFEVDLGFAREPLPYVFLFRRQQAVAVDVNRERVSRIASSSSATRRHYRILEPEYFPGASDGDIPVWRTTSVQVRRVDDGRR